MRKGLAGQVAPLTAFTLWILHSKIAIDAKSFDAGIEPSGAF